jgi:hypothetical protein
MPDHFDTILLQPLRLFARQVLERSSGCFSHISLLIQRSQMPLLAWFMR